jgi:hypothetical protein
MKEQSLSSSSLKEKASLWLHIILVLIAWLGPFIFWWPLMVVGYLTIQLQFYIYKMCLLNRAHGLQEEDDTTFYSHIFEAWGFHPNRKKLKFFIRQVAYIVLAIFTVYWQVYLGYEHLLQF